MLTPVFVCLVLLVLSSLVRCLTRDWKAMTSKSHIHAHFLTSSISSAVLSLFLWLGRFKYSDITAVLHSWLVTIAADKRKGSSALCPLSPTAIFLTLRTLVLLCKPRKSKQQSQTN